MRLTRLLVVAVAMISRRRRCRGIARAKRSAHGRREVALQLAGDRYGILGHVRVQQVIAEPDLAVGQHDRQLRARQARAALAPLGDLLVVRQELERAIELAGALQRADQVLVLGQPCARAAAPEY